MTVARMESGRVGRGLGAGVEGFIEGSLVGRMQAHPPARALAHPWRDLGAGNAGRAAGVVQATMSEPTSPIPSTACTCPACGSDALAIVEMHEHGLSRWWLRLRCGACAGWRVEILDSAAAERFHDDYESHIAAIKATADRLDRERLEAEIDVFAEALARDLIDAADFAR
jgi:hypothetical protein